jgi:hypothetical protein
VDDDQHFREALERKKQESKERSEQNPAQSPPRSGIEPEQAPRVEDGRTQDARDPRKKNTGHGKKTADKWNQ